jgi:hypothetical protein
MVMGMNRRDHSKDRRVDGMIILKWILEVWIAFIWLRIGTGSRFL